MDSLVNAQRAQRLHAADLQFRLSFEYIDGHKRLMLTTRMPGVHPTCLAKTCERSSS
jgi:hypothetical protein